MIVKMIVVCCFVARSFGMNNNTSVHEFESRVHAETAHTSLEKHTIDVGCLEMNELQKKHIYIYVWVFDENYILILWRYGMSFL